MYQAIIICACEIIGLLVIRRLARRFGTAAGICALILTLLTGYLLAYSYSAMNVLPRTGHYPPDVLLSATITGICTSAIFLVALHRLWPHKMALITSGSFGISPLMGIGLGVLLITPVCPAVWRISTCWTWAAWSSILAANILPGVVVEESIHRGVIYGLISRRKSVEQTLFWQAVAFSLMHIPGALYPSVLPPDVIARRLAQALILGYALGLLRERSGGIVAPICAHFTYNAILSLWMFNLRYF